jgi:hypothetical protein
MPDLEAAVAAHEEKERASAGPASAPGDRLGMVPHSVFDEHDVALREVQDRAEAERVSAYLEAGHVAAPGVGDYHATRRASKWTDALEGTVGEAGSGREARVEAARTSLEQARETASQARQVAAQTRERAAETVEGRQTRQGVMMSATGPLTGGLAQGAGEGASKSASTTGTASDDLDIDASTPGGPARAGGVLDTDQTSGEQTESDSGEPSGSGRSRSGGAGKAEPEGGRGSRGGRGGSGGKAE